MKKTSSDCKTTLAAKTLRLKILWILMDKSTVVLSKTKIDSDLPKFEWSKKQRLKKRLSIFYKQTATVIGKR